MSLDEFPKVKKFLSNFRDTFPFEEKSANGLRPQLYWRNKIVLLGKNNVIKIGDYQETICRLVIERMAKERGLEFFLEEQVISEYSNDFFIVTEEIKLDPCNSDDLQRFLNQEGFKDFLKLTSIPIGAFHERNIGKKKNKILAYDFFGNYFTKLQGEEFILVNQLQQEIYRVKRGSIFGRY